MHDTATSSVIRTNLSLPGRAARIATACLMVAAISYAGIAATWRPQELPPADGLGVFIVGALPGLLLVLTLWKTRPDLFDRRLRRRLIAFSLGGAAAIASLPLLIAAV